MPFELGVLSVESRSDSGTAPGNWKQVSDIVGTKEERECELHYFAYYINTTSGALPPPLPHRRPVP